MRRRGSLPGRPAWGFAKASLFVCVVAVVASQIVWEDRVVVDDEQFAVLTRDTNAITVLLGSQAVSFPLPLNNGMRLEPGLRSLLLGSRPFWLFGGLLFEIIAQLLLIKRWQVLLTCSGTRLPFKTLTIWHCRAQSIGAVLLGQIGSDAVRIQQPITSGVKGSSSTGVVVVERILGLTILTVLAAYGLARLHHGVLAAAWSLVFAGVVGVLVVWARPISRRASRWISCCPILHHCGSTVQWIYTMVREFAHRLGEHPQSVMLAALLTLGVHLSVIAIYVTVDKALCCGGGWALYLAAVPLVNMALFLPSLNGLFVFEGSLLVLLSTLGQLDPARILALCAAVRLLDLICRLCQSIALAIQPDSAHQEDLSDMSESSLPGSQRSRPGLCEPAVSCLVPEAGP